MTGKKRPKADGGGSGPNDPVPGDGDVWRAVVKDVTPLKRRAPTPVAAAPPDDRPEKTEKAEAKKRPAPPRPVPPVARPAPAPELPELGPGRAPGLDKRSAQRLARGQMKIDATLDLHGMTQAEAAVELQDFLGRAEQSGRRCVLVITGKGRIGEEGGVLRRMVPRWLNAPPNRARVLSFADAQPKHGGAGAMYVLLKRRR
jgi:DNA-nicking Smr family endonuclease